MGSPKGPIIGFLYFHLNILIRAWNFSIWAVRFLSWYDFNTFSIQNEMCYEINTLKSFLKIVDLKILACQWLVLLFNVSCRDTVTILLNAWSEQNVLSYDLDS